MKMASKFEYAVHSEVEFDEKRFVATIERSR
jgi:hypothetical protein